MNTSRTTLLIDEDGSEAVPKERLLDVIRKSFDLLVDHLGIPDSERPVRMRFWHSTSPHGVGQNAQGATRCHDGEIQVYLKALDPNVVILTLAHEMVHVRQLLSGDLVVYSGDEDLPHLLWKGHRYGAEEIIKMREDFILNDPSEAEAYSRMGELYEYMMMALPPEDAKFVGDQPEWTMPTKKTTTEKILGKFKGLFGSSKPPRVEVIEAVVGKDAGSRYEAMQKIATKISLIAAKEMNPNRSGMEGMLMLMAVARGGARAIGVIGGNEHVTIDDQILFGALISCYGVSERRLDRSGEEIIDIQFGPPTYAKALDSFKKLTGREFDVIDTIKEAAEPFRER